MKVIFSLILACLSVFIVSCSEDGMPDVEYFNIDRIYSIKTDGSGLKQLTTGTNFSLLSNNKIIYIDNKKLFSCDSDGSNKIVISPDNFEVNDYQFYLNSTKILLKQYSYATITFYIMNFDGSEFTQLDLPDNFKISSGLVFSPNTKKIAFTNGSGFYIMDIDGSKQIQIKDTTNRSYCYNINFTPDGDNVVYVHDIQHGIALDLRLYNIKSMLDTSLFYNNNGNKIIDYKLSKWNSLLFSNEDGINLENLNNYTHTFLHSGGDPRFSYDSTKITFMNKDFTAIYVMDLIQNSVKLININLPNNYISHPVLSIDEKRIIFQADTSWYKTDKINSNNNIIY